MYKFIINFKTYQESFDENSNKIVIICKNLASEAKKKNVELIVVPNIIDIKDSIKTNVKTYCQHIDNFQVGAHTGFVISNLVKSLGAAGTLINHSEHRLDVDEITSKIKICNELGLESCLCVEDSIEVKNYSNLKPDYMAIEPKELIGGDISISTAKPQLISDSVKNSNGIPILVGAGIKTGKDVSVAIKLGAKGILVASGVVKVKNIKNAILDLLSGF